MKTQQSIKLGDGDLRGCPRREDQSGNEFSPAQVSSSKEGGVGTPSRNENAAIRSYQLLPVRWNCSSDRYLFPTSPPNGFVQLHSAGTDYYYIHRHFFAFSFRTKYYVDVRGIAECFCLFFFVFFFLSPLVVAKTTDHWERETKLILTAMLWNSICHVPNILKKTRVTMISPCAYPVVIDLIEPNGPRVDFTCHLINSGDVENDIRLVYSLQPSGPVDYAKQRGFITPEISRFSLPSTPSPVAPLFFSASRASSSYSSLLSPPSTLYSRR